MLSAGTFLNDRYEVIEKIGSGGMSTVYRGKDTKLGRNVTIKVLKEELTSDDDFKERFQVEAQAAAHLSHPNIVNVYDCAEDNGIYYIIMEYIHGDSLKHVIQKSAPFSEVTALSIAVQIAAALSHAHKNGIVHRDIKPHNILVGVDGSIKVTDFGIARFSAISSSSTTINSVLGSVYYLSPEQARGGYVDSKSDIYSLGITMYEMLTGEVPFDGETSVSIALQHVSNPLPDIRKFNPEVSNIILGIIKKATEKRTTERYSDIDLMYNDLKKGLSDVKNGNFPVTAKAPEEEKVEVLDENIENPNQEEGENLDMAKQKMQVSKDDDNFENTTYSNNSNKKGKKPTGKTEKRDDKNYKSKEKKVVMAAILTSAVIISILSFFVVRFLTGSPSEDEIIIHNMPNLYNVSLEQAQTQVDEFEITLNVSKEENNNEVPSGNIVSQAIPEGTSISKGDIIDVIVSTGPFTYEMPSLVYENVDDAKNVLRSLGGGEAELEYIFSNDIPATIVIEQTPAEGTVLKGTDVVTLKVSKGAETPKSVVPNFVNMSMGDAQKLMAERGLLIGDIKEDTTTQGTIDTIISQTLEAGDEVDRGTRIGFTIIAEEEKEEEPDEEVETAVSKSFTIDTPTNYTDAENISVKVLQIINGNSVEVVYDQKKSLADFPFSISVTGTGNAEVQLYINDIYQWSQVVNFEEGGN